MKRWKENTRFGIVILSLAVLLYFATSVWQFVAVLVLLVCLCSYERWKQ